MSLKQKLENGNFVITAELGPPKGTNIKEAMEKANLLKVVDGINVTDNQRSVMRLSPISLCHKLVVKGFDPVFQITCRDRNVLALQSDLLSASVLGIKNVLALGGDNPKWGDHPNAKPVFDVDSIGLIKILKKLNSEEDLSGNKLEGGTNFFIGAALNPGSDNQKAEIEKFNAKVKAGAEFFQTQAVYDVDDFKEFLDKFNHSNVFILAGILPLKSAKMARFMNEKVPGINVPESLIKEIEESSEPEKTGIEQAARIIKEIKEKKLCSGVHIMAINAEEKVPEIFKKAGI